MSAHGCSGVYTGPPHSSSGGSRSSGTRRPFAEIDAKALRLQKLRKDSSCPSSGGRVSLLQCTDASGSGVSQLRSAFPAFVGFAKNVFLHHGSATAPRRVYPSPNLPGELAS